MANRILQIQRMATRSENGDNIWKCRQNPRIATNSENGDKIWKWLQSSTNATTTWRMRHLCVKECKHEQRNEGLNVWSPVERHAFGAEGAGCISSRFSMSFYRTTCNSSWKCMSFYRATCILSWFCTSFSRFSAGFQLSEMHAVLQNGMQYQLKVHVVP